MPTGVRSTKHRWAVCLPGILLCSLSHGADAPPPAKPSAPAPQPNTVFLCKDAGQEIYTNTQINKACKAFVLSPPRPIVPAPQTSNNTPGQAASAQSPAAFPKVTEATQKSRDTDRKRILEEELASEQKSLDSAKKELSQQETLILKNEKNYKKITELLQPYRDKIAQHERNIQALRKEMSNIK